VNGYYDVRRSTADAGASACSPHRAYARAVLGASTTAGRSRQSARLWAQLEPALDASPYLERPLAERTVIEGTSGRYVPCKNVYATLGQLKP
jgi:hypothetical protein